MAISKKDLAMQDGKFRRVEKYVYVRNGRVYACKWHNGKNLKKATPMQGALAINEKGEATKALREWVKTWSEQIENKDYVDSIARKTSVPTFEEVYKKYREIAEIEFQVSGRPRETSVKTSISAMRRIVRDCGLKDSDRVDMLTGRMVEKRVYDVVATKTIRATSAYADVSHAMGVFARWARDKYRDFGWIVPECNDWPKPRGMACQVRYVRPDDDLRKRTLEWWRSLEKDMPKVWLSVTMMIQFAMRNGDVSRLKWNDIKRIDGVWVLHYTPSKTRVSTGGRGVSWPVSEDMYARLRAARYDDEYIAPDTKVWSLVNALMRELGWTGTKASYELRKMAVDQIYRTQGIERAVQLSGDDTHTLMRYYADASRVSFVPMTDIYSK